MAGEDYRWRDVLRPAVGHEEVVQLVEDPGVPQLWRKGDMTPDDVAARLITVGEGARR
jgi:hypothetical protein